MKKKRLLLWILILITMAVIFGFSSQNKDTSFSLSGKITASQEKVVEAVFDGGLSAVESFIKKNIRHIAHGVLYFTLGILVYFQARCYGISPIKAVILGVVCCFLYGLSDEFHQRFSAGRTPKMKDVYIDTAGGFIGCLAGSIATGISARITKDMRK